MSVDGLPLEFREQKLKGGCFWGEGNGRTDTIAAVITRDSSGRLWVGGQTNRAVKCMQSR